MLETSFPNKKNKKRLIIVDLDGTLVFTDHINFESYSQALAEHGFQLTWSEFQNRCVGQLASVFLPELTSNINPKVQKSIHRRKKEIYREFLNLGHVNEGLINLLLNVSSTTNIALVTTASRENCTQVLKHFNLVNLFDLIVTGDDVTEAKPSPEGFKSAAEKFGVSAENTIIFEDSDVGIEAAKRFGGTIFRFISSEVVTKDR